MPVFQRSSERRRFETAVPQMWQRLPLLAVPGQRVTAPRGVPVAANAGWFGSGDRDDHGMVTIAV